MKTKILSRHETVKSEILQKIASGEYSGRMLPPEGALAKEFGVSLITIREALLVLQRTGVISKKHGSGNYIHKSVLDTKMRIDHFVRFLRLIEDSGYSGRVEYSDTTAGKPEAEEVSDLGLMPDEQVLRYTRTYFADGVPAIFVRNTVPLALLKTPGDLPDGEKDIFEFIWHYCGIELAHSVIELVPALAGKMDSELFGLGGRSSLLSWKELYYSFEDSPVCASRSRFNPGIMNLKMLWKL